MSAPKTIHFGLGCLAIGLTMAVPRASAAELTVTVIAKDALAATESVVYAVPKKAEPVATTIRASSVIDQVQKEFVPLVSVVRVGTSVSFPNSDNIRHQVYSFSPAKTFTLKLYSGRASSPVLFDKPGVVTLGCNIHDRMIAWLLIVDTPWYSLADATGTAALKNLPAGDYDLYVWHPSMLAPPTAEAVRLEFDGRIAKTLRIDATPIAQLRRQVSLHGGAP